MVYWVIQSLLVAMIICSFNAADHQPISIKKEHKADVHFLYHNKKAPTEIEEHYIIRKREIAFIK